MGAIGDITGKLLALRDGQRDAMEELLPMVYEALRGMARRQLGGAAGAKTISPTVLVHEAYLRLVDQTRAEWNDRRHFFAVAARAMRQIAVDYARAQGAKKRGGEARRIELDDPALAVRERFAEILDLDDALTRLAEMDERLARVVELRYFAGLTVEETAEVMGVAPRTVKRDWAIARGVLHRLLRPEDDPPPSGSAG